MNYKDLLSVEFTYQDLLTKLENNEQFSFTRYGDGEWNAIYRDRKSTQNCDGHTYYKDMGERLKEVLESTPNYLTGLQTLAYKQRTEQIELMTEQHDLKWCRADILHRANIHGNIYKMIDIIKDRDVLLIGPKHLREIAEHYDWYFGEILSQNCWLEYDKIHLELKALLPLKKWTVLYCASMMSNVLIDDFAGQEVTQIDLGSVLDPHVRVSSRGYHKKLINGGDNILKR